MNLRIFILLCMIFLHIVDDYYLQGNLANFKCKGWWQENAPDKMYKYDYIIALVLHGFSWSFMVHIPVLIYCYLYKIDFFDFAMISILINTCVHAVVDNAKANLKCLNLTHDQLLHLMQIEIVWATIVW